MKEKVYPASIDTDGLASRLQQVFTSDGYKVQRMGTPDNLYVQMKKGGVVRTVVGLDQALTVRMIRSARSTVVSLGQAKWADKVAVEAIGLIAFMPLMIPASIGLYEQEMLPGRIWGVIDEYTTSQGVAHTQETIVEPVHCTHCGVTNGPDAKFCSACGAQLRP